MDASFRSLFLSWFLALFVGLGLGLFLAWFVFPVAYSNAQPSDLSAADKDDVIRMIASSYAVDNDFALAEQRLGSLGLAQPQIRLEELARSESRGLTQQALVKFRLDMNEPDIALANPTSTPRPTRDLTPEPLVTVIVLVPTAVPPTPVVPTLAPSPLPPTSEPNPNALHFELQEKRALDCYTLGSANAIQVEVDDASGKGLPGVAVEVNSALGNELFYTGLKPERDAGFGDVNLVPGNYSVHLVENASSEIIGDLRIEPNVVECNYRPAPTQGWYLVFRQVASK